MMTLEMHVESESCQSFKIGWKTTPDGSNFFLQIIFLLSTPSFTDKMSPNKMQSRLAKGCGCRNMTNSNTPVKVQTQLPRNRNRKNNLFKDPGFQLTS
jgi:hypothetical protein